MLGVRIHKEAANFTSFNFCFGYVFLIFFSQIKVIAGSTFPLVSIINFSAFRVSFISWKPPQDLDQILAFAAKSKSQETHND